MNAILTWIRKRFHLVSSNLFSKPYLPQSLIWATLSLAFTNLSLVLIRQTPTYWRDYSMATCDTAILIKPLAVHPLFYVALCLAYLIIVWTCLKIFTRSLALILWTPLTYFHLVTICEWFAKRLYISLPSTTIGFISTLMIGFMLVIFLINPIKRTKTSQRKWLKHWRTILSVSWGLLLIFIIVVSANSPFGGWQMIEPDHSPGKRSGAATAYNPERKELLMFGGSTMYIGTNYTYSNDTWLWDGKDWTELKPENSPDSRHASSMAYDRKNDVYVLYGGESQYGYIISDTWIWDGKNWEQRYPVNAPGSRRSHLMFYDPTRETVILAGGFRKGENDNAIFYDDTWEWDGKDWKQLSEVFPTPAFNNNGVIYDQAGKRALFNNFNGPFMWQDNQWSRLETGIQPPARNDSSMALDPDHNRILIFGGYLDGELNDTWVLEENTWSQLFLLNRPSTRYGHIIFYDEVRKSFVIYGGSGSGSQLDDMWEFTLP